MLKPPDALRRPDGAGLRGDDVRRRPVRLISDLPERRERDDDGFLHVGRLAEDGRQRVPAGDRGVRSPWLDGQSFGKGAPKRCGEKFIAAPCIPPFSVIYCRSLFFAHARNLREVVLIFQH